MKVIFKANVYCNGNKYPAGQEIDLSAEQLKPLDPADYEKADKLKAVEKVVEEKADKQVKTSTKK